MIRNFFYSIFLVLTACFFASCVSTPTNNPDYPPKSDSFWTADSPKNQGFDEDKLYQNLKDWADTKQNIHSVLIERLGKLIAEFYRTGQDRTLNESF